MIAELYWLKFRENRKTICCSAGKGLFPNCFPNFPDNTTAQIIEGNQEDRLKNFPIIFLFKKDADIFLSLVKQNPNIIMTFQGKFKAGFIGKLPGSLARTCNVATDRLVYQDVRGLSATEPCPGLRIGGRTMPKDAGMC